MKERCKLKKRRKRNSEACKKYREKRKLENLNTESDNLMNSSNNICLTMSNDDCQENNGKTIGDILKQLPSSSWMTDSEILLRHGIVVN